MGETEDEVVGWHHQLNAHEFEQTLGDRKGQGGLACCSACGRKESDTTEELNRLRLSEGETTVDVTELVRGGFLDLNPGIWMLSPAPASLPGAWAPISSPSPGPRSVAL